ncbi:hypothetical protein [Leyella stercorea]|uniref:hypothetical protein n=1 Tax=Leyella stercorea TaxID=363265 RepID=UPI0026655159|nr:hypothetical protein [Leyella stercorea]
MKRLFATIVMVLGFAVAASAMSYSQAREQALFLTDKMAYELNLTDDQYEAAYEINLDYLLSVNSDDELYGDYWRWRNIDFSYVLLDWQYRMFCEAAYFYRPLYFSAGVWHFAIYARYPHRDYFYFHRPTVYVSYRGGHSWRQNNGSSWYSGRTFGSRRGGDAHFGMRDGFKRGDYGRGNRQSFGSRGSRRVESRGNSGFGSRSSSGFGSSRSSSGFGSSRGSGFGSRESSTRTTVRQPESNRGFSGSSFGSRRDNSSGSSAPRSTFKPSGSSRHSSSFGGGGSSSRGGGFGSRR